MDKNEYKTLLDEINRYVDQGNYTEAARAADTIDWKRVRNVRTLCLISEIYEAENRFEDSKNMLLKAYRKSPSGRAILYRLVEVCIRLKQFDEAVEYYSQYVHAAPNDPNRLILKYRIYRGRGSSVDEQIDILNDYLKEEYSEKYAYELAKLYQEADRISECLVTCDDLVLWFHSGKYVIRALELKKRYAPLTPKQQEIYDNRFNMAEEEDLIGGEKQIVETEETSLAESILEDTTREIASEVARAADTDLQEAAMGMEDAAEEQPAREESDGAGEESGRAVSAGTPWEGDFSGTRIMENVGSTGLDGVFRQPVDHRAAAGPAPAETVMEELPAAEDAEDAFTEAGSEDAFTEAGSEEYAQAGAPDGAEEYTAAGAPDDSEEYVQAGTPDEAEENTQAGAAASFTPVTVRENRYNTKVFQENMLRSMQAVVSGVGVRDLVDEDEAARDALIDQSKLEQAARIESDAAQIRMTKRLTLPELQKKADAGQLSIDDVLLSMGDRGAAVRETIEDARSAAGIRPQRTGVLSAVDEALLNMGAHGRTEAEPAAQEPRKLMEEDPAAEPEEYELAAEPEEYEFTGARFDAEAEEPAGTDAPSEQEGLSGAAATPEPEEAYAGTVKEPEAFAGAGAAEPEAAAGPAVESEFPPQEDDDVRIAEVAHASADVDRQIQEAYEQAREGLTPEMVPAADEEPEHRVGPENMSMREAMTAATRVVPTRKIAKIHGQTPLGPQEISGGEGAGSGASGSGQAPAGGAESAGKEPDQAAGTGETGRPQEGQNAQAGQGASGAGGERMWLKRELRGFFDGYLTVRDMDRQIAAAIEQIMAKGDDKTSRSGNVLIFGGHGCGKTTIGTGIAKAIAQERGSGYVKMARIYAADLNRKDIAATIARIAGGVLIVEEAGDLDDMVADHLTTAMEFRTDGLILILEDEQRYIHDLLMRHPRLTMKFTSQIYIPPFTAQDLTRFAVLYADDRDYAISPEAASLLQEKLAGMIENSDNGVSITNVLDVTDEAIARANKFSRKLFAGKKRFDSEGRVVLQEQDFR